VRRVFFALAAALTALYSSFIWQVFAATLLLAFGVRLAYVLLRWRVRPRLLSGWIFVIALGMLLMVAAGEPGRRTRRANAAAVGQGVVAKGAHATPHDRCVGMLLEWWDKTGARQSPEWTKAQFRVYAAGACDRAAEDHVLRDDGEIDRAEFDQIWYG
jgi:hypothetical protein